MLTANEIYEEYAKCLIDPAYVIEAYFKTFDKTNNGYVPFKLFDKQKEIVRALKTHRHNIIAKPRQAGVSTTVAANSAVMLAFADPNNPEAILIVANKQDMAFEFLSKIKDFLNQIPRWAWGPDYYGSPEKEKKTIFSAESKKEIKLPNGCRVKAVATSPDALRGYTPTLLIMDEAAFIEDGKELFGAAQTALGCLTKDSLILTENGLVQLDELVTEKDKIGFTDLVTPHKVCNMNGEIVDATQTFVSEYGETYKIKTKIGLELEGSWKHPLYVDNGGDKNWVRMNELQIGDKAVINYNQNYFGSDNFIFDYNLKSTEKKLNIPEDFNTNLDFAYLLGLFVAEGNFNSGGISITNIDKEITDFLINDGANLGRGFTKVDEKHYQLSSTKLVRWMAAFGLKKHNAKDKEIPLPILKMSKPVIVSFLRGLFDGDGCSTNKEIKYSSISHKLIKTLQILLLNFGIKSHIRYEEQKTSESSVVSNKNHITKIYNLCIYSDYALKFYDEIGFKLIRKQENRKYLIDRLNNSRHVYIDKEKVSRLLKDNNIPKSKVRFMSRFWDSKYNRLTYNAIFKLKASINSHPVLDELLYGVEQNKFYFTDEIVSIEKSEGYTYDLHVPKTNSFISNGLISHNTGGKSVLISCVTDDTFIYTDNGLRQVGDFINVNEPDDPMHGYVVNKYGVLGNGGVRYSDLFVNNGLQDTVKITTKYNFLEGTKPHKLWSYNKSTDKYDWHTLDSLSIDDFVLIKYGGMVFGNFDTIDLDYSFSKKEKQPRIIYDKVTEDLAYLIGLYIAEGSTYKKYNDEGKHIGTNITITCGDDISSAIDKCGFNYSCHDGLHYTISSKYLGAILEHLEVDLSLKSNDKFFSNRLLSLSKKNTMALIRGYMDGDGYSDSVRGRIGVNTSSKKLCLQLKHMLMNFGILTDYSEGVCGPTDRVKVSSNYYRISATSENAKKYYDLIGFSFERKQIKKCALKDKSKNHHYNLVPNGKKILRRIIDDNGLTYSFRGSGLKVNRLFIEKGKSADISKPIFVSFIDQIKKLGVDIEPYDIDRIIIENSIWCRIKNIELGKAKTYDFSLPENPDDFWCHSVLYNGMLGHQTPNGLDELYYETYDLALKKLNDFNIIEMRWYQDDRYNVGLKWYRYTDKDKKNKEIVDEEDFTFDSYRKKIADGYKPTSPWYEAMCRGMNNDARLIAQELDVSFLGSGGNVVSDEYIEHHRNRNVQDPKYVSGSESELWVWEEPIEGHEYILASDVSRGDGADYSTFTIIDFTTMTQVAEYMGRTPPDKLSNLLSEYGTLYNALVVVDITGGMGVATVLKLQDMKYPNLYYGEKGGQGLKKRKDMDKYNSDNEIAGFQVGSDRTRLVSTFEKMIRINKDEGDDHGIKIRSTRLLSELNSFVYINGRADHTKGKHDDLIMAMAMALFILENSFKQLKAIEQKTRAMLASWVSFSTSGELKVADVNNVNKNKNKPNFSPTVAKNMQDPNGEYMWLFGGFR